MEEVESIACQSVAQDLIEAGIQHRGDGDFAGALEHFLRALGQEPQLLQAYLEAGKTEQERGDLPAALSWFDKAEAVSPSNFWPYYFRYKIVMLDNDLESALRYLSRALTVCKDHLSHIEYGNLIKSFIDARAGKNALSNDELKTLFKNEAPPGRPLENAMRVSLIKDEEDIIYYSLEASYRAGIRYYVIADNKSLDSTRSEIKRFASDHCDSIVFTIDDPIGGYFQAAKTMGLVRFGVTVLRGYGKEIDWIFPLDADGCIYIGGTSGDLESIINSHKAREQKILSYYLCNAATDLPLEACDQTANINDAFVNFASYCSQLVGKVAFRYSDDAFIDYGNHYCDFCVRDVSEVMDGSELGTFIEHYPARSFRQLRSKIMNGGKAIAAVSSGVGIHWQKDYNSFLESGDQFIRKKLLEYCATTREFSIKPGGWLNVLMT